MLTTYCLATSISRFCTVPSLWWQIPCKEKLQSCYICFQLSKKLYFTRNKQLSHFHAPDNKHDSQILYLPCLHAYRAATNYWPDKCFCLCVRVFSLLDPSSSPDGKQLPFCTTGLSPCLGTLRKFCPANLNTVRTDSLVLQPLRLKKTHASCKEQPTRSWENLSWTLYTYSFYQHADRFTVSSTSNKKSITPRAGCIALKP